jgi:hypothetical protein
LSEASQRALAAAVATAGDDTKPAGVNAELDERIAHVLERVAERTHTTTTLEADAIEEAVVVGAIAASADPRRVPADTPGPGAASAPPVRAT